MSKNYGQINSNNRFKFDWLNLIDYYLLTDYEKISTIVSRWPTQLSTESGFF